MPHLQFFHSIQQLPSTATREDDRRSLAGAYGMNSTEKTVIASCLAAAVNLTASAAAQETPDTELSAEYQKLMQMVMIMTV